MATAGASTNQSRMLAGKRLLDLVLGSICALVCLPLLAVLALATAVTLRTWPLFTQRRSGHGNRTFLMIKLRTLPRSAPRYASKHELVDDLARLPRLARVLRRTHLDELPQLFLVPLGQMSLVGPRPRMEDACDAPSAPVDTMRRSVRQGCTGIWQISEAHTGLAAGAPHYDSFYLQHATLRLDLWILGRTALHMAGLVQPITLADIPRWLLRGRPYRHRADEPVERGGPRPNSLNPVVH